MNEGFERFLAWERASRDTIDFKKIYVDIAGDIVTGLMLSQIIYWHLPDLNGNTKLRVERDNYLWLVKRRTDWWDECRISPKQADRALAELEKLGIVQTMLGKFDGAPIKHIRLDADAFLAAWNIALGEKWISTKGENPVTPHGEMDITRSGRSLTKTTTQTTSEITPIEYSNEEDSSTVRRVVLELARDLGDEAPDQSIGSRAVNLWQQSGLSRAEFLKLAYRARDKTRKAQGKQPPGVAIANKAAYFFEVIEGDLPTES